MLKHYDSQSIEKGLLRRYYVCLIGFTNSSDFAGPQLVQCVIQGNQCMRQPPAALFVKQPGSYPLLSVAKQVYSSSSKQDFCKQLAETVISIRAGKFGNSHIFTVNIVTTSGLAVTLNYPAGAPSAVTGHVANNHCVSLPSHSRITFTGFHFTKYTPSLPS